MYCIGIDIGTINYGLSMLYFSGSSILVVKNVTVEISKPRKIDFINIKECIDKELSLFTSGYFISFYFVEKQPWNFQKGIGTCYITAANITIEAITLLCIESGYTDALCHSIVPLKWRAEFLPKNSVKSFSLYSQYNLNTTGRFHEIIYTRDQFKDVHQYDSFFIACSGIIKHIL